MGLSGDIFDALDQIIGGVDIYARVFIGNAPATFAHELGQKRHSDGGVKGVHARGSEVLAKQRTSLLPINPVHPEPHRIRQVISHLEAGKVVVYPTDTLYGVGADMAQRAAVDRLYSLRKLSSKKPLSLVCASLSQVSRYAVMNDDCYRFMKRYLPGPYTFILSATRAAPRMGQRQDRRRAVGIRIPDSPVALALVENLERPLLSTSALPIDHDAVSDPVALAEQYGGQRDVAVILDAGLLYGTPSTVIDWTDEAPVLLRQGRGDIHELDL